MIAARYIFCLPDLGEGIAEAEVVAWLVAPGDDVTEDAYLAEVQTDKAVMELPSPVTGTVLDVHVPAGQTVHVGTTLIVLGLTSDAIQRASPAIRAGLVPVETAAAPLVRRMAQEASLSLATLTGSGAGGRVTESDVRQAIINRDDGTTNHRIALRGVRRLTAQRLLRAHREVPAVAVFDECDFTDIKRVQHSYVPHLIAATVRALRNFPEFNASVDGEDLVLHKRFDIGIAVQTPDGLVVPVIREAGRFSLEALAEETTRLSDAGRHRRLTAEALRKPTLTISAAGSQGALLATPIINYPEVAMLALHRIAKRPAVIGNTVMPRRIGLVSLTFDHRVADGIRATSFLRDVIAGIRQPSVDAEK